MVYSRVVLKINKINISDLNHKIQTIPIANEVKPAMRKSFQPLLVLLLLLRSSSLEMTPLKEECASGCSCLRGVDYKTNKLDLTVNCHGRGFTGIPSDLPTATTALIISNFISYLYHDTHHEFRKSPPQPKNPPGKYNPYFQYPNTSLFSFSFIIN